MGIRTNVYLHHKMQVPCTRWLPRPADCTHDYEEPVACSHTKEQTVQKQLHGWHSKACLHCSTREKLLKCNGAGGLSKPHKTSVVAHQPLTSTVSARHALQKHTHSTITQPAQASPCFAVSQTPITPGGTESSTAAASAANTAFITPGSRNRGPARRLHELQNTPQNSSQPHIRTCASARSRVAILCNLPDIHHPRWHGVVRSSCQRSARHRLHTDGWEEQGPRQGGGCQLPRVGHLLQ